MKPTLRASLFALATAAAVLCGFGWLSATRVTEDRQALPDNLVALDSEEGTRLRERATAKADLEPLLGVFQGQERPGWCGVASQAMVLSLAHGRPVLQADVFTQEASAVRTGLAVTFAGMTLDQLGRMLSANGLDARVHHAASESVDAFRSTAAYNLESPRDQILVNYSRAALAQGDSGHISPLGAYDSESDRFLVLDVAAHRWPPVWVDTEALYAAMNTVDPSSGQTRGFVVVEAAW